MAEAPAPIIDRDPGDEDDHRHAFDPTTSTCACGLTAEQLRTH